MGWAWVALHWFDLFIGGTFENRPSASQMAAPRVSCHRVVRYMFWYKNGNKLETYIATYCIASRILCFDEAGRLTRTSHTAYNT